MALRRNPPARNPREGVLQYIKKERTQDRKNYPQKKHLVGTVIKNILLQGLNRFHDANLTLNSDMDQDT